MTIIALSAFQDNYIWVIKNHDGFICVDPGDAAPVIAFAQQEKLTLNHILLTHHHADHIGGVAELKRYFPEVVIHNIFELTQKTELIQLGQYRFDILNTPGHTQNHVCYFEPNQHWLFCGDTLFSAGCGRVFDGTITELYASIQQLKLLPDDTKVFCAHEYTRQNLKFSLSVEPNNQIAQEHLNFLKAHPNQNSLPSTISLEKQINPFLRLDQPDIRAFVQQHGGSTSTDEASFAYLRRIKNDFNT
ncbi:MAG: hydroxyacylglutathione hydrolase [Legionellaceae bacterium]|nr:hydroxyacylglutathione hydrolase [Legionellaceae bacterium]